MPPKKIYVVYRYHYDAIADTMHKTYVAKFDDEHSARCYATSIKNGFGIVEAELERRI